MNAAMPRCAVPRKPVMSVQRTSTVSAPREGRPVGTKQGKVYVPEASTEG